MRLAAVALAGVLLSGSVVGGADAFVLPHCGLCRGRPLSPTAARQMPEGGGEDEGQGGSRFREMMEKSQAEYRQTHPSQQQQDPYQQQQPQYAQGSQYQQQQAYGQVQPTPPGPPPGAVLPPGWAATVDPASGRTYYYSRVTGETSWTPPVIPPPPPPPPMPGAQPQATGAAPAQQGQVPQSQLPRVIRSQPESQQVDPDVPTLEEQFRSSKGKRREFDQIANTADVYLAQLKRDSTVRKIAWQKGDLEKANEAFGDESIKELETWVQKNPHTDQEEHIYKMVGTSEDETLLPGNTGTNAGDGLTEEERRTYSGISYKEKLAERMRKKKGPAAAE